MSADLNKIKQEESASTSDLHTSAEGPRRSQRLLAHQGRLDTELEQCRAELLARTEGMYVFLKTLKQVCG